MDLDNRAVTAGGRHWEEVEDGIKKINGDGGWGEQQHWKGRGRVRAPEGWVGRGRSEGEGDSRALNYPTCLTGFLVLANCLHKGSEAHMSWS